MEAAQALAPLSVELAVMLAKHYLELGETAPALRWTERAVMLIVEASQDETVAHGTILRERTAPPHTTPPRLTPSPPPGLACRVCLGGG